MRASSSSFLGLETCLKLVIIFYKVPTSYQVWGHLHAGQLPAICYSALAGHLGTTNKYLLAISRMVNWVSRSDLDLTYTNFGV